MPLTVRCPACGKGHKAPERAAGRTVACMACGAAMKIPQPQPKPQPQPQPPAEPQYSLVSLLDDLPAIERPAQPPKGPNAPPGAGSPAQAPRPKFMPADAKSLLATHSSPLWRRQLHWLLGLALIPLVVLLLTSSPEEVSFVERLFQTLEEAHSTETAEVGAANETPQAGAANDTAEAGAVAEVTEAIDTAARPDPAGSTERDRLAKQLEEAPSLDDILALLPGERLSGAFLARSSMAHWFMAAAATIVYMAFFMFLAADGSAKPLHVLAVGLFTSTIGVGFLLAVQFLASVFEGHYLIGFNIVTLLFYLLKLIALSYSAAADPENGFFLSFVGFTLGVGLCEELVKSFPLFRFRDTLRGQAWRGLFIWGLASGAGFGIAEGIIYSSTYYNGISGPGIYLVRFLSCVALHAIWTGSVAIFLYERRDSFDGCDTWYEWIAPSLIVLAVPAVLHGLYDTCLKKDFNGSALLVALASFGYLAFLFRRLQVDDDVATDQAVLRALARRRRSVVT
jgi:RsiW-degrading membrane proteinase PrsW (M82 family)